MCVCRVRCACCCVLCVCTHALIAQVSITIGTIGIIQQESTRAILGDLTDTVGYPSKVCVCVCDVCPCVVVCVLVLLSLRVCSVPAHVCERVRAVWRATLYCHPPLSHNPTHAHADSCYLTPFQLTLARSHTHTYTQLSRCSHSLMHTLTHALTHSHTHSRRWLRNSSRRLKRENLRL